MKIVFALVTLAFVAAPAIAAIPAGATPCNAADLPKCGGEDCWYDQLNEVKCDIPQTGGENDAAGGTGNDGNIGQADVDPVQEYTLACGGCTCSSTEELYCDENSQFPFSAFAVPNVVKAGTTCDRNQNLADSDMVASGAGTLFRCPQ